MSSFTTRYRTMSQFDWNAILATLIRTGGWIICISIAAPIARLWIRKSLALRELELKADPEGEQPRCRSSKSRPNKDSERKRQLDRREFAR